MRSEASYQRELQAAGYRGTFGLVVLCMMMIPLGIIFASTFLSIFLWMIISMTFGNVWLGHWVFVVGYLIGALAGLGWAVERVEKGKLKARALVNAANLYRDNHPG